MVVWQPLEIPLQYLQIDALQRRDLEGRKQKWRDATRAMRFGIASA